MPAICPIAIAFPTALGLSSLRRCLVDPVGLMDLAPERILLSCLVACPSPRPSPCPPPRTSPCTGCQLWGLDRCAWGGDPGLGGRARAIVTFTVSSLSRLRCNCSCLLCCPRTHVARSAAPAVSSSVPALAWLHMPLPYTGLAAHAPSLHWLGCTCPSPSLHV